METGKDHTSGLFVVLVLGSWLLKCYQHISGAASLSEEAGKCNWHLTAPSVGLFFCPGALKCICIREVLMFLISTARQG